MAVAGYVARVFLLVRRGDGGPRCRTRKIVGEFWVTPAPPGVLLSSCTQFPAMSCPRCSVLALTLLCATRPAHSSPVVRAELGWHGLCENRGQLEAELLERGVQLVHVSGPSRSGERLKLFVSVEGSGEAGKRDVVATLDLEGAAGGRERRVVEAPGCDGLQSAVAVILAVFAQQAQSTTPAIASSDSTSPSPPTTLEEAKPAEPIRAVELAPKPSSTDPLSPPSSSTNAAPSSSWKGGELLLGTALVGGYGWVGVASVGPTMHLEWRPTAGAAVALRASLSYLTTLDLRRANTEIVLRRQCGGLSAKLDTPIPLLHMVLGAELGRLLVSAPGLADARDDHATWYALLLMPELDLPLYGRVLFAQLGTGILFAPTQYQLKYQDTDNLISKTRRFEWRAELGVALQLTPTFP